GAPHPSAASPAIARHASIRKASPRFGPYFVLRFGIRAYLMMRSSLRQPQIEKLGLPVPQYRNPERIGVLEPAQRLRDLLLAVDGHAVDVRQHVALLEAQLLGQGDGGDVVGGHADDLARGIFIGPGVYGAGYLGRVVGA